MVSNILFKPDFSPSQFKKIDDLYKQADDALKALMNKYPNAQPTWDIIRDRIQLIKRISDSGDNPSEELKRKADISTLLNNEFRELPDEKNFDPLFQLDHAFTLLGMKEITLSKSFSMKP